MDDNDTSELIPSTQNATPGVRTPRVRTSGTANQGLVLNDGEFADDEEDRETPPPPPIYTPRKLASVGVLLMINLLNYMDRYTIVGVLDRLTKYFDMNDKEAGILQTVFITFYMVFAPLFGYLGDRYNRKMIMIVGISIWIAAVFMSTFAGEGHFLIFLFFRGVVGIGEASYSTVAPTIIADTFKGTARSRILMVFYFAVPIGSGLGFIAGSHVALLTDSWQWGVRFTPILGIVSLLLLLLLVEEPVRGEAEGAYTEFMSTTISEDFMYLTRVRTFILCTLASTAGVFAVGALSWWTPSLVEHGYSVINGGARVPASEQAHIQLIFGVVTCLAGVIGVVIGSLMAEAWREGKGIFHTSATPKADTYVCAIGGAVALPFLFLAIVIASVNTNVTWVLLFVAITAMCLNWSINMDIVMYVVIPPHRATAIAIQTLVMHLLGDAASPYIVGSISDVLRGDDQSPAGTFYALQQALYVPTVILVVSIGFYLFASFYVDEDRKQTENTMNLQFPWTPSEDEEDDERPRRRRELLMVNGEPI